MDASYLTAKGYHQLPTKVMTKALARLHVMSSEP
jgi:hypothetical protein